MRLALGSAAFAVAMAGGVSRVLAGEAAPPGQATRMRMERMKIPAPTLLYHIQNPFARIPQLPVENQFQFGLGATGAMAYELGVRPIIPIDLIDEYALVTRSTFRLHYEQALEPGGPEYIGLGDIDQVFYLTTDHALDGKWIFGAGPAIRWPSATHASFGGQLWGMGPAAGVIYQPAGVDAAGGWTFMFLSHHLFDIAGRSDKGSLSYTQLMPELSYTTEGGTNLFLDTEPVYDWIRDQWVVPVNFSISQLMKAGGRSLVLTLGGQYFACRATGGPEWGGQISVDWLFPE